MCGSRSSTCPFGPARKPRKSSRPSRKGWWSPLSATALRPGPPASRAKSSASIRSPSSKLPPLGGAGQDRFRVARHAAHPGRFGLRLFWRPAPPGPDHRQPEGCVGHRRALDRHRSSPQPPHWRAAIRRWRRADPGRRLGHSRCRAAAADPQARQAGHHAPDFWSRKPGTRPLGQRHCRSPRPRPGGRTCWSAATSTAGTLAPERSTTAPAWPSPPPRPSGSWMQAARCAPSAWSGSVPKKSACSAARLSGQARQGSPPRIGRKRFRRRPRVARQQQARQGP